MHMGMGPEVGIFVLQVMSDAYFKTVRGRHTARWCKRNLIGPMREALTAPREVPPMSDKETDARQIATFILALQCRACGGCELGRD